MWFSTYGNTLIFLTVVSFWNHSIGLHLCSWFSIGSGSIKLFRFLWRWWQETRNMTPPRTGRRPPSRRREAKREHLLERRGRVNMQSPLTLSSSRCLCDEPLKDGVAAQGWEHHRTALLQSHIFFCIIYYFVQRWLCECTHSIGWIMEWWAESMCGARAILERTTFPVVDQPSFGCLRSSQPSATAPPNSVTTWPLLLQSWREPSGDGGGGVSQYETGPQGSVLCLNKCHYKLPIVS